MPYPTLVPPRILILLLLVALPTPARAQALGPSAAGVASAAMAGAGVASLAAPTALWLNPAGVARPQGGLSLGLGMVSHQRTVRRLRPLNPLPEARDAVGVRPLGHLALAQPLPPWGGRVSLALGYRTGLNSGSNYPVTHESVGTPGQSQPRSDPTRYLGTSMSLQEHLAYIGLALRWRWLQLGAALELGHIKLRHQRTLWVGAAADIGTMEDPARDMDAVLELSTPSVAPGAVVGLRVTPSPYLAAGVSLRLPVTHHLSGTASFTAPREAPTGHSAVMARDGSATLDLRLPLRLRGGLSAGWPLLRASVDVAWARWSSAGDLAAGVQDASLELSQGTRAARGVPLSLLPLGMALRDDISVHAGLSSELPGGFVTLRAGYAYHLGASDPDLPGAVALDLQRHIMGLGVELAIKPVRIGIALNQSFGVPLDTEAKDATLDNPVSPPTTSNVGEGRYEASATRVVVELRAGW